MATNDWELTGADLGDEIRAAKTAAVNAFMAAPVDSAIGAAAAVPPVLSRAQATQQLRCPLTPGDRSKLLTVVWRAIAQAIMTHIGPESSDGSVEFGVVEYNGVKRLDIRAVGGGGGVTLARSIPLPDGVGDPGDWWGTEAAAKNHVHPKLSDLKSTLFTAHVPNPLEGIQVDAIFTGYYVCVGELMSGWTESTSTPGVWSRNVGGELPSSFTDGVTPFAGMVLFAYNHTAGDLENAGAYLLDNPGATHEGWTESAIMRRHPDYNTAADYLEDMSWAIRSGTTFGGHFIQLNNAISELGTTEFDCTFHDTNPNTESYNLLKADQLDMASSLTIEALAMLTSGGGYTWLTYGQFQTLTGVPGVATIAAGKLEIQFLARVVGASGATARVRATIYATHAAGGDTQLYQFESTEISGNVSRMYFITQPIDEKTILDTDRLTYTLDGVTDDDSVTLYVMVNDVERSHRVSLPLVFTMGDDHKVLVDAQDTLPKYLVDAISTAGNGISSVEVALEDNDVRRVIISLMGIWHYGSGEPTGGTAGEIGDYYADEGAKQIYRKTGASTWTLVMDLSGTGGGSELYVGTGVPSGGLGNNGDHYLNSTNGDFYEKSGGSWSVVANIMGPQGQQGTQGIQGPPGPLVNHDDMPNIHGNGTEHLSTAEVGQIGLVRAVAGDTPDVLFQRVQGVDGVVTNVAGTEPNRYVTVGLARNVVQYPDVECVFGSSPGESGDPFYGWTFNAETKIWTHDITGPIDPSWTDGHTLGLNDSCLVWSEDCGIEHLPSQGIYKVIFLGSIVGGTYSQLQRIAEMDAANEVIIGGRALCRYGTLYGGNMFIVSTAPMTIDVGNIDFIRVPMGSAGFIDQGIVGATSIDCGGQDSWNSVTPKLVKEVGFNPANYGGLTSWIFRVIGFTYLAETTMTVQLIDVTHDTVIASIELPANEASNGGELEVTLPSTSSILRIWFYSGTEGHMVTYSGGALIANV